MRRGSAGDYEQQWSQSLYLYLPDRVEVDQTTVWQEAGSLESPPLVVALSGRVCWGHGQPLPLWAGEHAVSSCRQVQSVQEQ